MIRTYIDGLEPLNGDRWNCSGTRRGLNKIVHETVTDGFDRNRHVLRLSIDVTVACIQDLDVAARCDQEQLPDVVGELEHSAPPLAADLTLPPFEGALPVPVFFRTEKMGENSTYPLLTHPWGEFVYSFSGVTEIKAGKQHLIAPPHLGLWIAPGVAHTGFNHLEAPHCSIYIGLELCQNLPQESCALLATQLLRALPEHLAETEDKFSNSDPDDLRSRLLRVVVDQIATYPRTGSFVPYADNTELSPGQERLRPDPANNQSVKDLAHEFHSSERTLMRRCNEQLSMLLSEWRQRLRLLAALALLTEGRTVESVALDLGHSTSSGFIAMFKQFTGSTPTRTVGGGG